MFFSHHEVDVPVSLVLKNVVKRVGPDIHIHDTSVEFESEGFNILLGTTLAGKTTLMQLMAGLSKPSSGEIWFGGKNVTGVSVQKRNVSMVHQQFINYPNFSVFENIASPLRVIGLSRREIDERVERIAELLKLTPMLGRNPSELSGGQQQRTALARALVKDADLVLLDEPLANLDYKLREELREELPKLFKDRGCTVVYATSEPMEALLLGGRTATIHEGRIAQYGPTSAVYHRPHDLRSARVFSEPPINTANVTKSGGMFRLNDAIGWAATGDYKSLKDGDYIVAVRPHHVTPLGVRTEGVEIEGMVLVTELSGSESVVHFEVDGKTWISQSHGVHSMEIGTTHKFMIDIGHSLYFDPASELIAA